MPSSLNSLEYSRGFTFHIDESPRYGNFQKLDHLPRVGKGARAGEHYVPYFTNQQIFKTASSWLTSWQPWQQRVLLCGIADRLPVHQIDILATTLEPVCHRDYVTACRRQYPSTPFRTRPESGLGDHSDEEVSTEQSTKSEETNFLDVPDPPVVSHDTSSPYPGGEQALAPSPHGAEEIAREILNEVVQKVLDESCHIPENTDKLNPSCDNKTNNAEVLTGGSKDGIMNCINSDTCTDEPDCDKAIDVQEDCSFNDSGLILSRSESELSLPPQTPPQNTQKSHQVHVKGLVTNPTINLEQGPLKRLSRSVDHIAVLTKISPRSPLKHKSMLLASPQLQTPDFFNRARMSRLGPLQRSLDLNDTQRNQADANIALNLAYKNLKWWAEDPPNGRVYIPARKRELLAHFKEQLQQIWKWLELWSDFERVAFVKEMIKSSETDVITTFANYIHQRLRDARDINRLADGLLLQVFSLLSPVEVCRAAQVCRRWRYVAATDSLWRSKCQQLVDREGLGELNELVMRLGSGKQGVDWRKAHGELTDLANRHPHRLHTLAPIPASTDRDESVESMLVDDQSAADKNQGAEGRFHWKPKEKAEEIRVKLGTESQIIRYKQADVFSDNDSDISEDLVPLMMDYNYFSTNALKEKKRWQNRRVVVLRKYPAGRTRMDVVDGQKVAEGQRALEQVVKTSRERIRPEDLAYDIRPRLRQTKDLLGKTAASHRLQWGSVATKQTPPQSEAPVAGQVTAIRRVRKLQGHEGGVLCVHFDQRRLASGGWDRVIRLWDVRSGRSLRKFYGHRGGVHSLVFDNDIMVSGSWDMTVMVWCMKKFTRRFTMHDHRGCVSCLCLHPKYIISGSHDKTVRVYSRLTLLCSAVIADHQGAITCLTFDGTNVLSGSTDKTLRLTNIHSQETVKVFTGMQAPVLSLQSQGSLLIGGDSLGRVYFWDQSTGESEAAIQAHDGPVNSLGFWSGRLLTASGDCTIKEWDINTMTAVRCLDGHKGPVNQMKVSDKRIVSCSEDGNVRVWDTVFSRDSLTHSQRKSVSRKPKAEQL